MEIQALLNSATNLVLIMYPAHHSVCRSLALLLHRLLSTVGRASNLYFELGIDYEKALAFRKANGDLSFEEFEIEYKYLKAVIEGGLEKKPDNILIYATSNRRHLVRETFRDKQDRDEELHTNDTVQEKLSLVARFGVKIYFASPAKKAFQKIVTELAKRNHISMPEEELLLEVNKWELSHGGMSGRTAQQFIDYLLGKE